MASFRANHQGGRERGRGMVSSFSVIKVLMSIVLPSETPFYLEEPENSIQDSGLGQSR